MIALNAASRLALLACCVFILLGAWTMPAQSDDDLTNDDLTDDERAFREAASLAAEGNIEALEKLANAGDLESQYFLGVMYMLGRGVDADHEASRRWFTLAAERNHAKSQLGIGGLLLLGKGGPEDFLQGIDWMKRAADAGNSTAQIELGRLYFEGAGDLPIDRVEAYVWFSLATVNPDPDRRYHPSEAQHFLDDLESNYMEEAQVAEARARALAKISAVRAD